MIGVTPILNQNINLYTISLLAAIIPGYGTICKWFKNGVLNDSYSTFLVELSYIIKTHILSENNTVIFIMDNCKIHKTKDVQKSMKATGFLYLYTIPYSPHLNLPVESYFGNCKGSINEYPSRNKMLLDGIYNAIISLWHNADTVYGDYIHTAKLYKAWVSILQQCKNCLFLTRKMHLLDDAEDISETISNLRCFRSLRASEPKLLHDFEKMQMEQIEEAKELKSNEKEKN